MSVMKKLVWYLGIVALAWSLLLTGSTAAIAAPAQGAAVAPSGVQGVLPTEVRYVMALSVLNVRSGPGYNYAIIGRVRSGEVATVTGLSNDRLWWQIRCTNNTSGLCWLIARSDLTQPVPGSATGSIPTVPTDVKFIVALLDANIRSGPGTSFPLIGRLASGQTIAVTGLSVDHFWWRVACPGTASGNCFVAAQPYLTQPAPGPGQTDHIPVLETDVRSIVALSDVNIRSGPGLGFPAIGRLPGRQSATVTGKSQDSSWWRIGCGATTSCWVSAKPQDTRPASTGQ